MNIKKKFDEWLEKEHPAHSVYDHENRGAYERWLHEQFLAFKAGYNMAIKSVKQFAEFCEVK